MLNTVTPQSENGKLPRMRNETNQALSDALNRADEIILGKSRELRLAIACLLARGHLLIEDVPGIGKTTLAHTLGAILGLEFRRVQFTSDLLPADIVGVTVFDQNSGQFNFTEGPVFTQLLLADEVNRASPKTQSALLEAMEERQVTVDGETRTLPEPFFVVATQNPSYQLGTFPLPESQLDRFTMRLSMGYPSHQAELTLLKGEDRRTMLAGQSPLLKPEQLLAIQNEVVDVHTSDALLEYLLDLVRHTREHQELNEGLSPRAGLSLKRCAQAWAYLEGRSGVLPEDVQAVFVTTVAHRMTPRSETSTAEAEDLAREILEQVAVP